VVAPSQKFLKIWRMRNEGSAPWSEHTALSFIGGDLLGAPRAVLVGSVPPGIEVDLSVDMIAPTVPGRYVSYWRLSNPDGSNFGHRLWVEIIVPNTTEVAPTNEVIATPAVDEPAAPEPVSVPEPAPASPAPEQKAPRTSFFREDPTSIFADTNPTALLQAARELFGDSVNAFAPLFGVQPQQQQQQQQQASPVPQQPVPVAEPVSVPSAPVVEPVPEPAPIAEATPVEAEILATLREMGFSGDLLTALRNHNGELFATLQSLLNQ